MKTFIYKKVVNKVYSPILEDYEEECENVYYDASDAELLDAVVDLVYEDYFKNTELADECVYSFIVKQALRKFIYDNDNLDKLVDDYENRLKDYFEEYAV